MTSDPLQCRSLNIGREVIRRLSIFGVLFMLLNGLYSTAGALLANWAVFEIVDWATTAWHDRAIRRLMEKHDRLRGDRP
jgi:hypothetical protein